MAGLHLCTGIIGVSSSQHVAGSTCKVLCTSGFHCSAVLPFPQIASPGLLGLASLIRSVCMRYPVTGKACTARYRGQQNIRSRRDGVVSVLQGGYLNPDMTIVFVVLCKMNRTFISGTGESDGRRLHDQLRKQGEKRRIRP